MSSGTGGYSGVFSAMPTPLTAAREIDRDATQRVVDYLLDRELAGLAILGSTGECAGLSRRQRREAAEIVAEAVNGRAMIIGGAAGTAIDDLVDDIAPFEALGFAAALVPPPFYFRLDAGGVIDFYERLADRSPIPIFLYNIPQSTKVPIPLEAVARLAEHPNIAGMKDSDGNLAYFTAAAELGLRRDDFAVFTGADTMLAPSLLVGGCGLIGAGANVVPELFVQLERSFSRGEYDAAMMLQRRANEAMVASGIGGYPANFKAVLALRGLCQPTVTIPLRELSVDQLSEMQKRLANCGIAVEGFRKQALS